MGFKKRSGASSSDVKTLENDGSVADYLATIADPQRREECKLLLAMMKEISGEAPKMWGTSIVGFGRYHYRYATGREGDWMRIGFSARKQSLTVYSMAGFGELGDLLARLGKVKHSVSCLYLPSFDKVDVAVLRKIIERFWKKMAERYPA